MCADVLTVNEGACLGILEQLLKLINDRLEAASIPNSLHMKAGQLEAVIGALIVASSRPETMIDTAPRRWEYLRHGCGKPSKRRGCRSNSAAIRAA